MSGLSNVRLSAPFLLFTILWLPELRLSLSLVSGNSVDNETVMKLLVAFAELLFVALVTIERRFIVLPWPVRKLALPALLWASWMIIASLFSGHLMVSLFRTVEWLSHSLFFVSLVVHLYRSKDRVNDVINVILLGFLLLFMLSVYASLAGGIAWFSYVPGFTNIRHFGHFALIALVLSVSYDNRLFTTVGSLFRVMVMIAAWTALIMSGGRGAILSIVLVTVFLAMRGFFSGRKSVLYTFTIGAVAGCVISLVLSEPGSGIYRIIYAVSEASSIDALSSSRVSVWQMVLMDILQHPLVGMGPEGYVYTRTAVDSAILHPHNILFQMLVEWGLPGTLVFSYILYVLFRAGLPFVHEYTTDATYKKAFWAVCVSLFYALMTGNLYIPFSFFLFLICLAIFAVSAEEGESLVVKRRTVAPFLVSLFSLVLLQAVSVASFVNALSSGMSQELKQIVMMAPGIAVHPKTTSQVIEWARESARRGNETEAMEWLDWGRDVLPKAWMFSLVKAEILSASGRRAEAIMALPSDEMVPLFFKQQVACIEDRIAN